jgi:peptidoglycan/xylan/chitin deacetylase (PgdA/CDA1 family)
MKLSRTWARIKGRYQRTLAEHLGRRPVPMRNPGPLISFTFDDFPVSALRVGGAILKRHGVEGTYYAAFGLMGKDAPAGRIFSPEDLPGLLADGHELGCHTFAHCDSWATRPDIFEESILQNRQALAELVPGCRMSTLSYPISFPRPGTKLRAGRHFAGCRSGGQSGNAGTLDLNHLQAFFLEMSRNDPGAIRRAIDRNGERRGWLIFATHDVTENPSRYGCTPALFEEIVRHAVDSGARVVTVTQALAAIGVGALPGGTGRRHD